MHTIIPHFKPSDTDPESAAAFRLPHFECTDLPQALKLTVLVPGVEEHGVEVLTRGPDLIVTARKPQIVRVNWRALHLEGAQKDYQLKLRLGHGFEFGQLRADFGQGILTIHLPKRSDTVASAPLRHRRVA